jgi:hypothetical protein
LKSTFDFYEPNNLSVALTLANFNNQSTLSPHSSSLELGAKLNDRALAAGMLFALSAVNAFFPGVDPSIRSRSMDKIWEGWGIWLGVVILRSFYRDSPAAGVLSICFFVTKISYLHLLSGENTFSRFKTTLTLSSSYGENSFVPIQHTLTFSSSCGENNFFAIKNNATKKCPIVKCRPRTVRSDSFSISKKL